jgi:hypothetical protein
MPFSLQAMINLLQITVNEGSGSAVANWASRGGNLS